MELEEKTVLVTGAAGTVGSTVATRLVREGAKVRAMARNAGLHLAGAETVVADLNDHEALTDALKGAHVVVHCAASLSDDLDACTKGNVDATRNLLSAMHEHQVAMLVHISTVSVYDKSRGPVFEEGTALCTDSKDAYAFTKAKAEGLVRASGLKHVILRPPAVLSTHPGSYWGPKAVKRAKESDYPVWPFKKLNYVHVDNLAEAVVLSITTEKAWGRVYNVVDDEVDSSPYLARIYQLAGKPAPTPKSNDTRSFPSGAIRSAMKWKPREELFQSFLDQLKA
ncbi:MAG: NAD(P)-dependent oxidoreductase [Myxococcaceae bacterium]